jgi:hypothetical protein
MKKFTLLFVLLTSVTIHSQELQSVSSRVDKVSKYVSGFLNEFSDVKCTERVVQAKLTPNGKNEYSEESTFDYLVIMQGGDGDLLLSESRLQEKEARHSKQLPMLVTNGFSTLFLVFHPYYRDGFTFTFSGEEIIDGKKFVRLRFDHILGTRTPMALAVRGREYPLELTGTALVDDTTGAIARIDAGLVAPMDDIGLRALQTKVDYLPLPIKGIEHLYRFPMLASVEVQTLKQHWRNTHRFSDYKRFSVDTEVTLAEKK